MQTNRRGNSIKEVLENEINYIEGMKDSKKRILLSAKALGAVDLAVDFGLITYKEWEKLIHRIFFML